MATAYGGYTPLDESQYQIRIITIHAAGVSSDEFSDDILTCTLEAVALRYANPFFALSYVWGPSTPTGPISINGQIIHVRRNLWLFLLALRDRFCRRTSHVLSHQRSIRVWADYVCIQQSDIQERNFQVAMMGDVYKASDAVYAWLGELTTPIDDGMRCISEIAALRKRRASWAQIRRDVDNVEARVQRISTSQYWNRMWIKQEALLAKDLWFFCGEIVAHWKDLSFAIQLCPARTRRQSPTISTRAMLSLFQARESGKLQFELPDLVERFADASCQDPRDRIYALLALVDKSISQQIVVDYQKPVLQVLLENYRHWSNGGILKSAKSKVDSHNFVYHPGHFCKVVNRVLPKADFETLYNSKDARSQLAAQGTFVATDMSFVVGVCPIAIVSGKVIHPFSRVRTRESGKNAFVSTITLRPDLSSGSTRSRQCFIYSHVVPDVKSLVVWIGPRVLFLQLPENVSGDQVEEETHLGLIGTGAEVRERGLTQGGGDQLSRQFLMHPSLWLEEQLDDARFAVHMSGSRVKQNNVSIICNAAAVISLLHEYRRDQDAPTSGEGTGSCSFAMVTDGAQARLWSPYTFGMEHKLLHPCELCKSTGRSAALSKVHDSTVDRPPCNCQWICNADD